MKQFSCVLVLFLSIKIAAQQSNEVLLGLLDKAITERADYARLKEMRLDSLKQELTERTDDTSKYQLYNALFKEYKHYNLDAALWAARGKLGIAGSRSDRQALYESEMNVAEMLGKMGMYKETFDMMGKINKQDLDKEQWGYYFHLFHSMYALLLQNALSQEEKTRYKNKLLEYKDSLLQVYDPQTLAYKLIFNGKLIEAHQYTEALALMTASYNQYKAEDAEISTIAYSISDIYEKTGNTAAQERYLAISALSDIKRAAKSYISLRKLAVLLYRQGDIERAYTYIKCAMEDATFCKARFRMIEISEALPIIVAAYDKKMKEEKQLLFINLVLISVLSVGLLVALFFIYRQLKKIAAAKQFVKKANDELTAINDELKELNAKLSESNQVKETYIGYVFHLCSAYINKIENYRTTINQKLKAKQIDEALKITSVSSLVTNELKEFFQNFDAVFLTIYPDFIQEFNLLLKKEEQINVHAGDILTPELRVFALIRLGISDSSKIANFLHYSPQTVYNYKLKIKNKLAVSKEAFAHKINHIGKGNG